MEFNPGTVEAGIGFGGMFKRYWYIIFVIIFILPSIINSISTAIETNDPTYPFFQLGEKIISADTALDKQITLLETNPASLVGMEKPPSGVYYHIKYYILFFWNVILDIISNIFLIFLPFSIILMIANAIDTTSPAKNWIKSFLIFALYLFVVNTIMFTYEAINGSITLNLSETSNKFIAYGILLIKILPFHGLIHLGTYLISLIK
jgi:hypothetical protein